MNKISWLLTALVLGSFALTGCSGGSGQSNEARPNASLNDPSTESGIEYKGSTAAATNDVRNYLQYVWTNLASETRCGACHVEGDQSPQFVRGDDINLAYTAANDYIDLSAPGQSRLVSKVAQGHNCWLTGEGSDSACATSITNMISNWANAAGVEAAEVTLTRPEQEFEISPSRSFPGEDQYRDTIHRLVTSPEAGCHRCHSDTGIDQQQKPYFASENNVALAYEEAKSKITLSDADLLLDDDDAAVQLTDNLIQQMTSRLVVRSRDENHFCWSDPSERQSNCEYSAETMAKQVQAFFVGLGKVNVDDRLVVSSALRLSNGVVASSDGRYQSDAIALYQFNEGPGANVAFDTSVAEPGAHLNLSTNGVDFLSSWGIRTNGGKAQASSAGSRKLHDLIKATGEYAIEAWVAPANVTQDNTARIVTYSFGPDARNVTLGQTLYNYDFLSRSSLSDVNGMPALSTPDADDVLQATLQHVVVNFHPIYGRTIYVNGELVAQEEPEEPTSLNDWDSSYALAVGGEIGGQNSWDGVVRFLAVHNRTLAYAEVDEDGNPLRNDDGDIIYNPERIIKNYEVGVGQKFFMLFGVGQHLGMDSAYVVFTVELFDDYSYLFSDPFFFGFDETINPDLGDIEIGGIRIGINGQEAKVGQTFANVAIEPISAANYQPQTRYDLFDVGGIIPLERGSDNGNDEDDQFFLTFDNIGRTGEVFSSERDPDPTVARERGDGAGVQPDIGVRHFAEINATMSAITTVPTTTDSVAEVYTLVERQMPVSENIEGFLASNQAGIMQLAVAYCTALITDAGLETERNAMFNNFNFARSYPDAFPNSAARSQVINALASAMLVKEIDVGGSLLTFEQQPDPDDMSARLDDLIVAMDPAETEKSFSPDESERDVFAQSVGIASCSAALGSAIMLVQ